MPEMPIMFKSSKSEDMLMPIAKPKKLLSKREMTKTDMKESSVEPCKVKF